MRFKIYPQIAWSHCIVCICLTFLHCGFSNVSSKHMQETIKRHIDCIYLTFLHCQHNTVSFRGSPPHQQGLKSLLAGVWASEDLPWLTPPPTGLKIPVGGGVSDGSASARLPPPTHPPTGKHPCQGCCPCARCADTNFPRVSDLSSRYSYLIL